MRLPLGYLRILCRGFEEAADSLGPTPNIGNVMSDRFGPEITGECTLVRRGGRFQGGIVVASVKASPKMA
jgi:hypothetical protein